MNVDLLQDVHDELYRRRNELARNPAAEDTYQMFFLMFGAVSVFMNHVKYGGVNQYPDAQTLVESGLTSYFEFLVAELKDRLERPVKMCGAFGKPRKCPSKETGELRACMESIWGPLGAAIKSHSRVSYPGPDMQEMSAMFAEFGRPTSPPPSSNLFRDFAEDALAAFDAVESATACRQFERIDNFAANKGKYTKGFLTVFRMLCQFYLEQFGGRKGSNVSTMSSWNSQSMGGGRRKRRGTTRRRHRKSKTLRKRRF
jgi:hypothetical protein